MPRFLLALLVLVSCHAAAQAPKQTVCTITVNSADEREAFRAHLPADRFDFVELVERGRPDWLRSACERGVRCDVLVVSGHFAGTEFYSSKPDVNESLRVDEIERARCSESCPGLFDGLREVYLFGCDSLKAEPVKDHGEASRDVMRRLFAGTPLIYGFSSLAPYGRVAGPMLDRHLRGGASEVGTGQASARLLKLFGPASMVATSGLPSGDPAHRGLACRFMDERVDPAGKLQAVAALLTADRETSLRSLERVEGFLASASPSAGFDAALAQVAGDAARRDAYLALARDTGDAALRLRMLAVAHRLRWLDDAGLLREKARLVAALLERPALAHGDVDLVCRLNADRALNAALEGSLAPTQAMANRAAQACLGDDDARARMIDALASPEEGDVRIAQAYFRHHPVADAEALRTLVERVGRLPAGAAKVRALETLARFNVQDGPTLEALARLFARSGSLAVQRAIAEIFVRAGGAPPAARGLAQLLRRHRQPSPGAEDLIDAAIRRLEAS